MLIFDQFKKGDRPLWALTLGILLGMGTLLGGLWYMQVLSSQRYVQSQKTQSVRQVRFPALRGRILDRNGVALAENQPSFNLNLYLEELGPQFDKEFRRQLALHQGPPAARRSLWQRLVHWSSAPKDTRRRLKADEMDDLRQRARYLVASNVVYQAGVMLQKDMTLDEKKFQKHFGNRRALPLPVLENITPQQMARFFEQTNRPPGLNLDYPGVRVYTNGTLAAHVLGNIHRVDDLVSKQDPEADFDYCLPDYEGEVGLEAAFDDELRGHAGAESVVVNNMGYRQSENVWAPAEPGQTVVTTLDVRIQRAAEQALARNGAETKGAIVVLNAQNGDVLAMASAPTYNPNAWIPRMSTADWERLSDTNLNCTLNRATAGAYAPGSIFKIIIGLAGLEAGTLHPDELIRTEWEFRFNARSRPIKDLAQPDNYNFQRAFAKSSNYYFIVEGLRAGRERIMDMAKRFFLGQKTELPLRQERSGFVPTPAWVEKMKEKGDPLQPGDDANLCIGQGYLTVTPIQMAVMTAAVANGGKIFWPRLVDRIEPRESGRTKSSQQFPPGRVRGEIGVSPVNLHILKEAMLADVEGDGTGKLAAVPGLQVCGKTGTAQFRLGDGETRHDVWFVSFAPYEAPRYAVVVFVEGGGFGGTTCAPMAKQIYQTLKNLESQRQVAKTLETHGPSALN